MRAGGAHVPELLERVEERLARAGRRPRRAAGRARRRRRSPPAASACARCWSSWPPTAEDGEGLVRAAAAVELVHSATLVHDDVLDAARAAPRRPTVVATAGRGAATATGDLLFARAFAELARQRARRRGARALRRVVGAGRGRAAAARRRLERRRARWSATCAAASSRPRACSRRPAGSGALEAGGAPEALGAFGRRIGLAFQLLDDVLDVSGPAERTGKQRGTDLLDGTVTLPLHPRPRARPRARRAGPALDRRRRGGRGRLRPHRGDRRAGRGARPRAGDGRRGQGRAARGAAGAPAPRARARGRRRRGALRLASGEPPDHSGVGARDARPAPATLCP